MILTLHIIMMCQSVKGKYELVIFDDISNNSLLTKKNLKKNINSLESWGTGNSLFHR